MREINIDQYLNRVICGPALEGLKQLPDQAVQCVICSPPYWNLRDYGVEGQLGLEKTPEEYIEKLVMIFREVRRVLRDDGTLWLNMGDSYASGKGTCYNPGGGTGSFCHKQKEAGAHPLDRGNISELKKSGLKPKDLCGMPWRVAFALQADGWYLRSDIIWHKPNPMPESVTDRPTKSHEYIFLFAKSGDSQFWTHRELPGARAKPKPDYRWIHKETGEEINFEPPDKDNWKRINLWRGHDYFYDSDAIREPHKEPWRGKGEHESNTPHSGRLDDPNKEQAAFTVAKRQYNPAGRNKRTVWTVATQPYKEAHFATYPEKLIEPCILAGTSEKGCCSRCGSPWSRITKPTEEYAKLLGRDLLKKNEHPQEEILQKGMSQKKTAPSVSAQYETIGWQPTCKCNAETAPCIVMDIFSGAATTAVVAIKNGRDFIDIELNPEYIEIGNKRIKQARDETEAAEKGITVQEYREGQESMF